MNEQVYGLFESVVDAERALSALKDHGATSDEVSVVHKSDGSGVPEIENEADHSISGTSPGDVVAGAMKGGAVGVTLGILGAAVALTIPGVGPILAAGPLAAAFGVTLISGAAGAATGGVVGYMVDQGIPEEAAHHYHNAIDRGDILVAVRSAHVSSADAAMLLEKYGAAMIGRHAVGAVGDTPGEPPIVDTVVDMHTNQIVQ